MRRVFMLLALALMGLLTGCRGSTGLAAPGEGAFVDRRDVEYPPEMRLEVAVDHLHGPTALAFDDTGALIVAEGGTSRGEPTVTRFVTGQPPQRLYPPDRTPLIGRWFAERPILGAIGGMTVIGDEVFLTHVDERGAGIVSALPLTGGDPRTVVADLPAMGDHDVNGLRVHPTNGRLYFGVGSATNSGVVGLDNFRRGWAHRHPDVHDTPAVDLKLLGYRFDTDNPAGGWFGGDNLAVTGPFQPFGLSAQLAPAAQTGKPTAAVYSVSPGGGDLRVEAHGLRNPVGLAFNAFGNLFVTNRGMQLRGTRPVRDDPDVLVRVPLGGMAGGTWFGWPDYSADLSSITEPRFQPPVKMIARTGYPELSTLVDHEASGLLPPDRETLLQGVFDPLAGVAGMDFAPDADAFQPWQDQLIVALSGKPGSEAHGGLKLARSPGHKVVRVQPDRKIVADFIYNTRRQPATNLVEPGLALQRPIAVLAGPEGALYVLDEGRVRHDRGEVVPLGSTGRVYRLLGPIDAMPAMPEAEESAVDLGDDDGEVVPGFE